MDKTFKEEYQEIKKKGFQPKKDTKNGEYSSRC